MAKKYGPERAREIERIARIICVAMGDNPDALQSSYVPYQTPTGVWQVADDAGIHLGWMRYWRAAVAVYTDAEFMAQFANGD